MTGAASHCETCCPWYPEPCAGDFSSEFGPGFAGGCGHESCGPIELEHCVGSKLDYGSDYPWECLPWQADTGCDDSFATLDESLQKRALTLAWNTMSTLTAGRIAAGCVILRPCLSDQACPSCYGAPNLLQPTLLNGEWYNLPPCRPPDCSCCDLCEIVFPGSIAAILEVNIDGYRHDPRLFRVDDGNRLVRQDGCCFPSCQDMGAPYGYYGTFGIRYVPGIRPRAAGLWAVGVLASEFAKACVGGKCRLPTAVTSISRQGINMEITQGMFQDGTGIREVDAFIHSVNPGKRRVQAKVFSPDVPQHRITTTQIGGIWP